MEYYNMIQSLIFSSTRWLYSHLWFSDIAMALLFIFIFNSILQRLTTTGPMTWPVFGILPTVMLHATSIYEWGGQALIKSGGTFPYRGMWMGGTYGIVTSDPAKIEYILKTNFKNFPKGKAYRERFYDFLGDGIFNADDELWRQQRRVANSEMHSTRFMQFSMDAIEKLVNEKLLKVLEAKRGCAIDLQDVLLRFTFDNTCAVAFGVDSGCLEVELPEIPFAKAFEQVTFASLMRFLTPPYVWKPMKFFRLGFEKTLHEAVKIVHDFAEKTVRERKMELSSSSNKEGINGNSRCDLLSRLIILEKDKKDPFFTDKLLQDFCISFILAGRDTSSVGLAWFFWLITKNPSVETKILTEVREIFRQRENPTKENQENISFTQEELKKMVYLQAAISESLRLYPPVSFDHKEPQVDDIFPDGTMVEKGSRVVYCMYGMARMESIWGKDCFEFRPERWIKDGEFVSENQFKYTVFNAGPRLCVGKKFAYTQMKLVVASILWRYRIKVVEGHKVCPKINTTLYMKYGLLVTLEPRPNSID
ncbi:cytochrome P450 86B1-like [Cynara cardunculus var. scolymus]|uniref:cytochrome P450 86B1-like n=1 Tax=Cynara cardunculus var. scolymus TaxID=59895 RepID=UPI000D625EEE|nr:cytochrome P450 86B1-like [Cynara cardunculus var. scolymus]